MTCSRFFAGSPAMPDRRRPWHGTRPTVLARLVLFAAMLVVTIAAPAAASAAIPDNERCANATGAAKEALNCDPTTTLSSILPVLGVAALAGVLVLAAAAYLMLRRQAASPLAPADPGEWWACPKCGSTNVVGSARCYACGTWQR
jgi:hypothetical protein